MTQIQIKVEADKVIQSLDYIGQAAPRVVNADIEQVMRNAQYELQQPAPPPTYPINWDSEKQRRAFFATAGFGAGIPYNRSGRYNAGWVVEKTGMGVQRAYTLRHKWNKAKHVGGDYKGGGQSRIHRNRWVIAANVVRRHAQGMLVKINISVREVIRSSGIGS